MREVALLLNEMRSAGVITNYALFGALAQVRYTEAVATVDADVLVAVAEPDRLDVLGPIYRFCAERGHTSAGEAINVGSWPVQFVPVFSELTKDALESAEEVDFEGVWFRVVRADYLAVIALSVGRAKDFARILALLESDSTQRSAIADLSGRYSLTDAWRRFERRFPDE